MGAVAERTDWKGTVLAYIREQEGLFTPQDVAEATGGNPGTIRNYLRRFLDQGIVAEEEEGYGVYRRVTVDTPSVSETKQQKATTYELHMSGENPLYGAALPTDVIKRLAVIRRITSTGQPTGDGVLADRDEVELRAGAQAERLGYYTMPGDAMEGVISPGAPLDVVPGDHFSGPGIYMLILDGRPTVGHLQGKAGGTWRISYANPAYEGDLLMPDPETRGAYVAAESGLPVTFEIVGQVRGTYRRIG